MNNVTIQSNVMKEPKLSLLKINKVLTIGRWALEILTALYIYFVAQTIQPGWQAVEGPIRRLGDFFMDHFPFNDIQLTWMMVGLFGILIFVKYQLFKTTDFYKSTRKFIMDISTMIFWIVFCFAWLAIVWMGVVGEVFHFFNFIPYEWISILNYIF